MNPIENHEQRIKTLETQNLYLRTEVDQLTLRMNEMADKMDQLIVKAEEN